MAVVFDEIESTVEPAMDHPERAAQDSGPSAKPGGNPSERFASEMERLVRRQMRLQAD
jgi:hypothetical protein